jgi:membrane protease YdiL (CAAX protease family)
LSEELFFRKMLPETMLSIAPKLNSAQNQILLWVISATIFASVQIRPLLWLPAFFLGIGLSALAEHTGRLRECILAHALFNLLALALNWAVIL